MNDIETETDATGTIRLPHFLYIYRPQLCVWLSPDPEHLKKSQVREVLHRLAGASFFPKRTPSRDNLHTLSYQKHQVEKVSALLLAGEWCQWARSPSFSSTYELYFNTLRHLIAQLDALSLASRNCNATK